MNKCRFWFPGERRPDGKVVSRQMLDLVSEATNTLELSTRYFQSFRAGVEFLFRHGFGRADDLAFQGADFLIHHFDIRRSRFGRFCGRRILSRQGQCRCQNKEQSQSFHRLFLRLDFYILNGWNILAMQAIPGGQQETKKQRSRCEGKSKPDAGVGSDLSPQCATQRHAALKKQDVHGDHARADPGWARGLRHQIEGGENADPRHPCCGGEPGRNIEVSGAYQSAKSDGKHTCGQNNDFVEGKVASGNGQHQCTSESADSEKRQHCAVTNSTKATGNQRQHGPESAGKEREGQGAYETSAYTLIFVLAHITKPREDCAGNGGLNFVRLAGRGLPAIKKKDDTEERD